MNDNFRRRNMNKKESFIYNIIDGSWIWNINKLTIDKQRGLTNYWEPDLRTLANNSKIISHISTQSIGDPRITNT